MAGSELKFVISATDHASAVLAGVGKSTDQLDAKTRKLRAAAGLVSAGAIVAFGAASVKAYAEAEAQQVKLEEAYRKFPAVADVSIQSMRDLNSAIQAKTGSDDDELAAAEAKLAMYGLTGSQIQQLIPLVNDFAVAQGMGVTEAAQSVGKAMMGNAKALKGIGVDYKLTGDKARDFTAIMDALQGKVGGAGEAFGQTTAGQMKILQQSFSDLQEEVGAQLVPALKALVAVAKPILSAFGSLPEPVKTAGVVLVGLGAAALLVGPRLLSMVVSLRQIPAASAAAGGAMTRFGGAMKGVGVAATALAVGLPLVGQLVDKIGDNMFGATPAGDALKDSLIGIANGADPTRIGNFGDKLHGLGAEIEHLDNPGVSQRIEDFFGTLAGNGGGEGRNRVLENIKAINDGIAGMVRDGHIDEARRALDAMKAAAIADGASAAAVAEQFAPAEAAIAAMAHPTATAAEALHELTTTMASGVDMAKLHTDTVNGLKSALDSLGGNAIDVDTATANMYDSFRKGGETIAKATEKTNANTDAVNSSRASLDLHTEAGQAAQGALADIAQKADGLATAMHDAGRSTQDINDQMTTARAAFIKTAMGAGLTEAAANRLADSYGLIPETISTTITNNAAEAVHQAVIDYIASLNSIPEERRTQIITEYITEGKKPQHPPLTQADGGYIAGPGTSTSDSIPAQLSNGEFVIRASSVQKLGVGFLNDLNDDGQSNRLRFATGGLVTIDTRTGKEATAAQIKARNEAISGIADRASGFASLSGAFDAGAYPEALKRQADAIRSVKEAKLALAEANRKVALAANPEDRAAALKERADAERALAGARRERASADVEVAKAKPTARNIIGALRAKMGKLKTFSVNLRKLARMGIPPSMIKDLVDAGPEEGGEIAAALIASKPADLAELLSIQHQIDIAAGQIGRVGANAEGGLVDRTRSTTRAATRGTGNDPVLVSQTTLTVDGRQLAESLVRYRRSIGNRPLNLG